MSQLIPKVIYQTWYTKDVTDNMANVMTILRDLNPDYEYHLYDDSECEEYIQREYPQFMHAYNLVIPGAYKADLWRLLILYQRGGVYIDAKQHHLKPLSSIIDPDVSIFMCKDRPKNCIFNAILGAVPQHPYIGYCITMTVYNIIHRCRGLCSIDITGPLMIGRLLGEIVGNNGDWEMKRYGDMDIPIHYTMSVSTIVDRSGEMFGYTHYPNYYSKDQKQNYHILYKQGQLFVSEPENRIIEDGIPVTGMYPSNLRIEVLPEALDTVTVVTPVVKGDSIMFECQHKEEICVYDVTFSCMVNGEKKVLSTNDSISQCQMVDTTLPQRIPRIIYQTGGSRLQPPYIHDVVDALKRLNPEYEYRFYDDMDCREVISRNFGPEVVKAYDSLIPGAFRADLWRYCMLYLYGGVYIDHKLIPLSPLRDVIRKDDALVICLEPKGGIGLYNAFIACIPQHPLMKAAIDLCVSNVSNKRNDGMLAPTGPVCLYNAYIALYKIPPSEGRVNGMVTLRHIYMSYIVDMYGMKIFSKKNRAYMSRPHSYGLLYHKGVIFNDHISHGLGRIPIAERYRAYIHRNPMFQDLFDYRILPHENGLYLMIQRRDEHDGWGQPLMVDIYDGMNVVEKGIRIPYSHSNIYIMNIPKKEGGDHVYDGSRS